MAKEQAFWIDGLFDFARGINSGVDPLLLPRNQASFALNTTFRGTFALNRPGTRQLTLNYGGDSTLQSEVENGTWQGGCFYTPDFGNPSLIAAISGKLFQFSINGTVVTVKDISIPGDPNPATPVQAWLWQAENFVIWNDGVSLPVFFDGSSSRRSFGPQTLLAQIIASFTAPAVGSTVNVTVASSYTGPFNVPVFVNDPFTGQVLYQTVASGAGTYLAKVVNQYGTPGTLIPAGTVLVSNPNIVGTGTDNQGQSFPGFTIPPGDVGFCLSLANFITVPNGTQLSYGGIQWTAASCSSVVNPVGMNNTFPITNGYSIPAGTRLFYAGGSAPITTAVITTADFNLPAVGSSVTIHVDRPFMGSDNSVVYDNVNQYALSGVSSGGAGTTLTLINLGDVAGTLHSVGMYVPEIDLLSVPELPAGRMGAYGMGRNWVALTDGKQFIASDIVGGSSGTKANNFRDAVLKVTENTYLYGGGYFTVPGSVGEIRAMCFSATLDASLGQGPLQIYTPTIAFSCQAPVDRTTWQSLTNPILTESLISNGAQGQYSTTPSNSDTLFRSVDGIRSLILARREFDTWGNVPISFEVLRVLQNDNLSLLAFGSSINFDNRLLLTANPVAGAQGIYHPATIALNYDPISSIGGKLPAIYDGEWTGLNVLQYITGLFTGMQRAFAFNYNLTAKKIELWEVLTSPDNNTDDDNPITWELESPVLFKDIKGKSEFDLCRLIDGEIRVDQVVGTVKFQMFYRPDQYPCWTLWHQWTICSTGTQPGFQPRMGLGEPNAADCDPSTNRPFREGYVFQVRLKIVGHCRFLGARFKAVPLPDQMFAAPICNAELPTN